MPFSRHDPHRINNCPDESTSLRGSKRLPTGPIAVTLLVIFIAAAFNIGGIHIMQGLPAWQAWREDTYWYFVTWRALLYSLLIWGCLRFRKRLLIDRPALTQGLVRSAKGLALLLLLMELLRAYARWGA
ncbi:hypothetical protein [Pseudomonas gingeri]|uniref:Uncharacterized protein n=1 Tax=Pseudomonas gingeri TaxID=117681 RepID=A0A7Y7XXQ2_9PSED|nr:hypothetical protein [Pseudomonas gingeri]NVZ60737.1 hypothetical protein [Pseudomonas gingeri]NVZ75376.1 hypothetical protein [Pseudomonas gingeri]NWC13283.1 hypothetical protein [Pseudomonas gingeri]NWE30341.1 hypothetical protein [Pseudomonas gingeri]NWE97652.1 hypothetical protein [Pseudomonas gingeri]